MDAGQPTLKHLTCVGQQVPAIGNLDRIGCALRCAFGISPVVVTTDDLDTWARLEPGGDGGGRRRARNGRRAAGGAAAASLERVTRSYLWGIAFLAAVWGGSYLFIKVAVDEIEPAPMMAIRFSN